MMASESSSPYKGSFSVDILYTWSITLNKNPVKNNPETYFTNKSVLYFEPTHFSYLFNSLVTESRSLKIFSKKVTYVLK